MLLHWSQKFSKSALFRVPIRGKERQEFQGLGLARYADRPNTLGWIIVIAEIVCRATDLSHSCGLTSAGYAAGRVAGRGVMRSVQMNVRRPWQSEIKPTMIYTHVLNRGPVGFRSPADLLASEKESEAKETRRTRGYNQGAIRISPSCWAATTSPLRNYAVPSI